MRSSPTIDRETRVFIRDDDLGALTPEFLRFHALFAEREVPVSYQIIPERLTVECAAFLKSEQARRPDLIEFGQHGLRHEMEVRGKIEYYEFGPERGYEQQLQDIRAGKSILRELLGQEIELFTPPRHRYNRDTLRALDLEGLTVFSASSYPTMKHQVAYSVARSLGLTNIGRTGVPHHGRRRTDCGLFELSIAVAADDGGNPSGNVETVMSTLALAAKRTSAVGVMFHHQAYQTPARSAHLEQLVDRLTGLANVSFHTIGSLRRQLSSAA